MFPHSPRFTTTLVLALLVATTFAHATETSAPTAKFTTTPNAAVFAPITFDASASTGEDLTYEWDFTGGEEFEATATGAIVEHAFDTPGHHAVTLRVTDAHEATATITRTIAVDDFITLELEVLEEGDINTVTMARMRLTDWNGEGLENVRIDLRVFYQPAGQPPNRLLRTMPLVTGEDGELRFPIPRDTPLGNLVGDHFITGYVELPTSILGNRESAAAIAHYTVAV